MKITLAPFALGLICGLFTAGTAHAQIIDVYLLGGQSNMDGGDEGQPYSSVLPSNLQDQSNIQFYYNSIYYTGPVGLTSLEPVTNAGANYSYFGPEITFGADMAAYQNPSGVEVAIIKYSVGSSSLAGNWFAGGTATTAGDGNSYVLFQQTVSTAMTALQAANPGATLKISGMLWMQGEADAGVSTEAAAYQTNLTNFVKDIRLTYGANLPFVIGRLSNSQTGAGAYLSTVQAAQNAVAASLPDVGIVNTNSDPTIGNLHFTPVGQEDLGNQFATSMETLITTPEPSGLNLLAIGGCSCWAFA